MSKAEKTVFISYRRDNGFFETRSIFVDLRAHGYDVFWDIESIDSGIFDTIILNQIAARAHFLLILTPGTLDRTIKKDDWLRREIESAIDSKRNIVPIFMKGFTHEDGKPFYQGKLIYLDRINALPVPDEYFDAAMERLRTRFLKQPIPDKIAITPEADRKIVEKKIQNAQLVGPPTWGSEFIAFKLEDDELDILEIVSSQGKKGCTLKHLQKVFGRPTSTLQTSIDSLIMEGYLGEEANIGRKVNYHITPQGRKLLQSR